MRESLENYIKHRENDIVGAMLTADDKRSINTIIFNLVSDLSHSEAFILSLASVNAKARKYADINIKDGNSAYFEYRQKKPSRIDG